MSKSSGEAWRDMGSATSPGAYTQAKNDYSSAKNSEDGWAQTQARSSASSNGGFMGPDPDDYFGHSSGVSAPLPSYRWSSLWHTSVDVIHKVASAFRHDSILGWLAAPFQLVWYLVIGVIRIAFSALRLSYHVMVPIVVLAIAVFFIYGLWVTSQ